MLPVIACLGNMLAQNKLDGKIVDTKNEAVSFCPLALLNAGDSSIAKGTISDEAGKFIIEKIKPGSYLLKISYTGYADTLLSIGNIDSSSQLSLPVIILKSSLVNLNEVAITAVKKPMEFKNGNVTVNIDGSPLAIGNSAYDLLIRLPGVVVIDGAISIQGKTGARVLIDGKIQQFSGDQLMAFLKSMSANMIDKIEVLKNPPVKYDAAGNAGIINIITKKVKITGFSGSVNASNQQGFYDTQMGGFTLNYKGKKVTFYSGGNINNAFQNNVNHMQRAVALNGVTTSLDQYSKEKDGGFQANFFVGADWNINSKNTIGVRVEDMPGNTNRVRIGTNNISDNSLGYNQLQFKGSVPNVWNVVYTNLDAEHLFDTVGTKLKFNADYYGPFVDIYGGAYQNYFYNTDGAPAPQPVLFNNSNTITFSTLLTNLDFEKKLTKNLSMEAGAKGSFQDMQSIYKLETYDNLTGTYVVDTNYTNTFTYKEQILAGYLNLQQQIKKFNLQAGVRAENTDIHTLSITKGIAYTRQYFNLFPTASIGYNKNDKHNFQLSYNRRIDRPDYNSFNPYRQFFGNMLSYGVGNPYLLPSYTNNFELSHNYKGFIGGSVSYSRSSNFIYGYPVQDDSTKQTVSKIGNLKTFEEYAVSMFIQKDIKKWWTLSFNTTGFYFGFNGVINGVKYTNGAPSVYSYLSNMLVMPKAYKIEVSAVFIGPWLNAVNSMKPRYAINLAIKKNFFNDKLSASIGVNDMFLSLGVNNTVLMPNQTYRVYVTHDTRRFVTSLSYNFGKIKAEHHGSNSNDPEKRRMGR